MKPFSRSTRRSLIIIYLVVLVLLLLKVKFTHYDAVINWHTLLAYALAGAVTWIIGLWWQAREVLMIKMLAYALCGFGLVMLWVPFWTAFLYHPTI